MRSRRGRIAIGVLVGGLIVLSGFVFLAKRLSPAPQINVSLQFGGFWTNAATGVLATFGVSNGNPWNVAYRAGLPQARTNDAWSQVQITAGEMKTIRPGESINFLVSVPETTGVWRVPVVFVREWSHADRLLYWANQKIATVTGQRGPGSALTCYTNFTSEISR